MRVSSRVVLIACSASALGAPAAIACSPQDYMSPEEWQALSPEQRAENVAHTHEAPGAPPPASAPASPSAEPPATRDAAPQVTEDRDGVPGSGKVEAPPVRAAAPVIPSLDGPSHRPVVERAKTNTAPRGDEPQTRQAAGGRRASSPRMTTDPAMTAPAVGSPRRTVIAVEELTRMTAGSEASERTAKRRSAERRSAAERARRRASAPEVRRPVEPATDVRADAGTAGRTPARADEAPVAPTRTAGEGLLAAGATLLALLAGLAVLLLRPRSEPPAMDDARVLPGPHDPDTVAIDPVEAELQAMIAAQTAGHARHPDAQGAETGGDSSTATNSA